MDVDAPVDAECGLRWRSPFEAKAEAEREGRSGQGAWASQIVENAEILRRSTGRLEKMAQDLRGKGSEETHATFSAQIAKIREVEDLLQSMVAPESTSAALSQAFPGSEGDELVQVMASRPPTAVLNNDDPHVSCAVKMKIGQKEVRVLLDTGAVRSMMDANVAKMFQRDEQTREACLDPQPLSKPMNCEGAEKGTVIGVVSWTMMVKLGLCVPEVQKTPEADSAAKSPALQEHRARQPNSHSMDAKFYLMENLSDPIILGRPELADMGLYLEPRDDNGRLWVQFIHRNVRLPVIQPSRDGKRKLFRVDEPKILQGPDLQDIPVVISESDYRYYTH